MICNPSYLFKVISWHFAITFYSHHSGFLAVFHCWFKAFAFVVPCCWNSLFQIVVWPMVLYSSCLYSSINFSLVNCPPLSLLPLFYFIFPNWISMGVCVSNGLFSLFPCKVLPTLTISWFPKLVFFGSIIFLLHSTSKPLHLLLLHSMSSPGWFLLVLQASGQRLPAQRSLSSPTWRPLKTLYSHIIHETNHYLQSSCSFI